MADKNILTIILNDDYDALEMCIEKDSLINLPYFKAFLSSNFEENISGQISINVPDISAARNIIRGINKCKYMLDSYMCLDYFGINPYIQKMSNPAMDLNNFDSLIKISDCYNNPDDLIDLIVNNIPKDYNLTNIPQNILKKYT
uniref:Putative BTB_POZ domain-containing protein n=1 Tax=Moumouvirus sp. 'Monve' TaxID=1128131 RepID=H2EFE6_9VIRU|nr:putative BTB_POZ domain-containing protein [Moumouvirus Monve]